MVLPDGRAEIPDFGLARRDPLPATGSQGLAPTVAVETESGTPPGTIGDKIHEAARGLVVDPRSDPRPLGVVLLELLAGRPSLSAAPLRPPPIR